MIGDRKPVWIDCCAQGERVALVTFGPHSSDFCTLPAAS
jgi:hypothetical protein